MVNIGHVIVPAPCCPCQVSSYSHRWIAAAGVATSCEPSFSSNTFGFGTHQGCFSPSSQLYPLVYTSAKTSCTPLTRATLFLASRKPIHPPPQPQPEQTPQSPCHSTCYRRGSQQYILRSDCPIGHVNHLRPLSSHRDTNGCRSMNAEPTNKMPALFSLERMSAVQPHNIHSEKASGFCRCTLSVCFKCLSMLLTLHSSGCDAQAQRDGI